MAKCTGENLPKPGLFWLFFSFRGRIARQSYIFACLFNLVLLGLAVYQSVQGVEAVKAGKSDAQLIFAGFLTMAVMAFGLWCVLALSVKRLHDLDHPVGLIILLFVPALTLFALVYLMARPSYPQANEHGPPPQGG